MNDQHKLCLAGPFEVIDSLGQTWQVESVRIFDEGYGAIDVYVALGAADEDMRLHEDASVIRQVVARLRREGYAGPDFIPGAEDLQDPALIVLEAPEEFGAYAARRGWRNIADDYAEEDAGDAASRGEEAEAAYAGLMRRLRARD